MPFKSKEQKATWQKEYQKINKDKIAAYQKEYNQTPLGIKLKTISCWKHRGLLDSDNDNYESIYERYEDTDICDVCDYPFDKSNWRCMDHDHKTGIFRQVLCHKCNNQDHWIFMLENNYNWRYKESLAFASSRKESLPIVNEDNL